MRLDVKRAMVYLIIFIVGFIGVSLWSFWLITHPPKIIIGTTPENFGFGYEDVELKTEDGLKLSAWFIPTSNRQPQTPALILIHGYPAEKADLLPLAKVLNTKYSLLLFDLRSFGQSDGRVSTLGKKELLDLEAALDFLENRLAVKTPTSDNREGTPHPLPPPLTKGRGIEGVRSSPSNTRSPTSNLSPVKIGIFGFSLGGAVAIMKAADDSRIQAIAAYAPFADLRLLGYDAYKNLWLLKYPLVELISLWTKLFFDYDIAKLSPEKAAAKLQIPIFIFHQKQDVQIPFEHALLLQKALSHNPRAQFQFPERGSHGDFPNNFDKLILEFFQNNI